MLQGRLAAAIGRGDYQAAGAIALQRAGAHSGSARQQDLLDAAEYFLRGHFIEGGQHALSLIEPDALTSPQALRRRLLEARLSLLMQRPEEAVERLQALAEEPLDAPALAAIHGLLAEALERQGRLLEAARHRSLRLGKLPSQDLEARRRTEQALWKDLLALSPAEAEAAPAGVGGAFSGWLELAAIARQTEDSMIDVEARLVAWRQRYPDHPASSSIIEALRERSRQIRQRPAQVAVLLPQAGPLAKASAVLRDGLLMSYYESQDYRPELRFYDSGQAPETALAAYRRAVGDGAGLVVGPLSKASLATLVSAYERMPVPTLALNYLAVGEGGRPGLIEFGLAPEDEVEQLAERAWLDGHNQALAMIPTGAWGDRLLTTFTSDWQALGGNVLKVVRYRSRQNDFSSQIRELLNLDLSTQRKKHLEQLLGVNVVFKPRRRQDADFLFLVAKPRAGRLIRPQLKFHFASDLAVYATSHVFSGHIDARRDRDMDGIVFCDMPWLLKAERRHAEERALIERLWPDTSRHYLRLYAMGLDTFSLVGRLGILRAYPHESLRGRTGTLALKQDGRLFRQLVWARFRHGTPRPD